MVKQPIPEISDERIQQLLATITPLARNRNPDSPDGSPKAPNESPLHRIEVPKDIRRVAFTWNPTFLEQVDESKLKPLQTIVTYHTAGHVALFKPSIAEVLAQIPDELVSSVSAFEVSLESDSIECVDKDGFYGHKAVTILYQH